MSTVQGSIWDLNNFFLAEKKKLKRTFNQKFFTQLSQILADVRYASSTIYDQRMGWSSLRRLFDIFSMIFPSEEKIRIHPMELDLHLKKIICYLYFKLHNMSTNLANVLAIREKSSNFLQGTKHIYKDFIQNAFMHFPSTVSAIYVSILTIRSWERGFYDF